MTTAVCTAASACTDAGAATWFVNLPSAMVITLGEQVEQLLIVHLGFGKFVRLGLGLGKSVRHRVRSSVRIPKVRYLAAGSNTQVLSSIQIK